MTTLSVDPAVYGNENTYWVYTNENGYSYVVRAQSGLAEEDVARITVALARLTKADEVMIDAAGIGGIIIDLILRDGFDQVPLFEVRGSRVRAAA